MRVQLSTDANCRDVRGTTLTTGLLVQIDERPPTTQTTSCDAATGRIGSIVVVPSDGRSDEFAIRVVTGFLKDPDECVADGYTGGCIVARRAMRFIPHETVELPISMEAACVDVPCGATETCRNGSCVDAYLSDPTRCTDPAGCAPDTGSAGSGAVTGAGGTANTGGSMGTGGAPETDAGAGGSADGGGASHTGGTAGAFAGGAESGGAVNTGGMSETGGFPGTGGSTGASGHSSAGQSHGGVGGAAGASGHSSAGDTAYAGGDSNDGGGAGAGGFQQDGGRAGAAGHANAAGAGGSACGAPHADSFADFSGIQGQDGWRYGYYVDPFTSSDFVELAEFVSMVPDGNVWVTAGNAHWTFVGAETMHPNGTITSAGVEPVEHHAVRRWTSDVSGSVRIHGWVQRITRSGATGVTARVVVDGFEIWSQQIPVAESGTDFPFDLDWVLDIGSQVDFVVDPYQSDDNVDKTRFRAWVDCAR